MSTSSPGRQQSLTDAIETARTTTDDDRHENRVVEDTHTCECGRPAGADGLCYACRAEHSGGRRL